MKAFLTILICVVFSIVVNGQIDSLKLDLEDASSEERLVILEGIAMNTQNADRCFKLADQLLNEAVELSNFYFSGLAHHYRGYALNLSGKDSESIREHFLAVEAFKKAERDDKITRQVDDICVIGFTV
ncbi:hypothetical protein N8911_01035 [bacterium]|nr:hypothetical protein [bacterium]